MKSTEISPGIEVSQLLSAQEKALITQLTELNAELYNRNIQLEKELYITRQIQQSFLPPFLPAESDEEQIAEVSFAKRHYEDTHLRISGVYLPCDALGGDLYDIVNFGNDRIGVSIADVSGHGVPAAFITAIFKASFYRTSLNYHIPGEILYHLNNELHPIIKTGDYVTTFYCLYNRHSRELQYSGAGHPYPFLYQAKTHQLTALKENGAPLIWFKDTDYPTGTVRLSPGDKILLFTDGITEMKNSEQALFGEKALEALFLEKIESGGKNILEPMIQALSDYADGHPLQDDTSMVLIEAL